MKNNYKMGYYIMLLICSAFLMINLKREFCHPIWNYFIACLFFMHNGNKIVEIVKAKKNEKNIS